MKVFMTIFNRFTWAIEMCKKFEQVGLEVIIIDNASTFAPCVEWLKNCSYKVEKREKNEGPWVFETSELKDKYKDQFFYLADSDFDLSIVPNDFPDHLMRGLETCDDKTIWKCGLSCELNDLDDNAFTRQVIAHENNFWINKNSAGYWIAWVDIGVTLHDRNKKDHWYSALRSDRPYTCRHLDWYHKKENIRPEDIYFWEHTKDYYGWGQKWYNEIYLGNTPR